MSKNFIEKTGISIISGLFLLLPLLVAAQGLVPTAPLISGPTDIAVLIGKVLGWLANTVLVVGVAMLLYAAILYMTAGASETILAKSKTVLLYAIIGIAVAVLAYSVKPFLITVFQGGF